MWDGYEVDRIEGSKILQVRDPRTGSTIRRVAMYANMLPTVSAMIQELKDGGGNTD